MDGSFGWTLRPISIAYYPRTEQSANRICHDLLVQVPGDPNPHLYYHQAALGL
jgi:hypothetical protein